MIVAIDPSFSGTGLVITSDDAQTIYYADKFDTGVNVYKNRGYAEGALAVVNYVYDVTVKVHAEHPEWIHFIAEIPALATKSGAYLAVIHGMLEYLFHTIALPVHDFIWVPCSACDSFTGNKKHSKTYLVNYVKEHYSVDWRINHDEATALIFAHLYLACTSKPRSYKNTFYHTIL